MGSTQSVEVAEEEEESDGEEAEEEEDGGAEEEEEDGVMMSNNNVNVSSNNSNAMMMMMLLNKKKKKKVLEQEPEMLPCYSSASPLSPQPSSIGTPRIKVWDPYHVLAPPPPPPPSSSGGVEVLLIPHGECVLDLSPDLVAGRCPHASLTPAGSRQARALAVFLNSHGVRFSAVYSSPLDRARSTATSVCKEMKFAEEGITVSEGLSEMSHGVWEGCLRSEVYTPEVVRFMESVQPDFSAPSGESLRQVQLRMLDFLNATVLGSRQKRSSGKSRLQFMTTTTTTTEENEVDDCVGVFSHALPIQCLLTGILGCSPLMSHKLRIHDSSVTVLRHSLNTGWQIIKFNDTAHLRLL